MNTISTPLDKIRYIPVSELRPNLYNPNHVAPQEMKLLKTSILEDGWLFPCIVFDKSIHIEGLTDNEDRTHHTVIDGFHRYSLVRDNAKIATLTNSHVPCIVINPVNPIATTVRLNRAKGVHSVNAMAKLIQREIGAERDINYLMQAYGMEKEEIMRLATSMGIPATEIVTDTEWSTAWVPAHK